MGIARTLGSVGSAVVLAAASVVALGQAAHGAAAVSATSVEEGQSTTITISGCNDSTLWTGATLVINNADGFVLQQQLPPDRTTWEWTAPVADAYGVSLTCHSYQGADVTAQASFLVFPTSLYLAGPEGKSTWNAGDPVTLHGYGFAPHESVSLIMVDKSTGDVVWAAEAIGDADAEGVFAHDIVLESDVPPGTYLLVAVGDESGIERVAEFYWGAPDGQEGEPVSGGGEQASGEDEADSPRAPAIPLGLPNVGA